MYIIKNAYKSIVRAKGRNLLVFILVFLIAVSACVALSVRNSAETAKETVYSSLTITAQISANRQGIMGSIGSGERPQEGEFDPESMMGMLTQSLTLEEMAHYAESEYVDGFYYTSSAGVNVPEDLTPYENTSGNFGGLGGMMGGRNSADLTVIGYSSHDAMTTFISGENVIYEGNIFEQDSSDGSCVISYELALLNDLAVGDRFTIINPQKEDQVYTVTICGTFLNESSDAYANTVMMSYSSLNAIVEDTVENAEEVENERGGTSSTALRSTVNGTYVFANTERYEGFLTDVEALGLDTESYAVTSTDLNQYEKSVVPLESLSKFTTIFFLVVLLIGGGILVIFNMFTVRERKYEIGVLAAIGMKKGTVALQFLTETFLVTLLAVVIGTGVGAAASQPVGDYLLQEQVASAETTSTAMNENFGGGFQGGGFPGGNNRFQNIGNPSGNEVEYLDSLNTTTDATVLLSLMAISILLTLIASNVGMISVLRYEPLKILSER